MQPIKNLMITGANRGIGKETAKQAAALERIEKIYLACRNPEKAQEAKTSLEESTGKKIFEVITLDVSDLASVREAVKKFNGQLDALVLNAGGLGGSQPFKKNEYGVTSMFASNVLGHFLLVEELMQAKKLKGVVLYSGSEASRGFLKGKIATPDLSEGSVEVFKSIANGEYFEDPIPNKAYGYVKLTATLAMAALSQKYSSIKFITMSPGATETTSFADNLFPLLKRFFKSFAIPYALPLIGVVHRVDKAAARYIEGITNTQLKSGHFYASKPHALTGPIVDQKDIFPIFNDRRLQENAYQAIWSFLKNEMDSLNK